MRQKKLLSNLPPEKVMHPTFANWRTTIENFRDSAKKGKGFRNEADHREINHTHRTERGLGS